MASKGSSWKRGTCDWSMFRLVTNKVRDTERRKNRWQQSKTQIFQLLYLRFHFVLLFLLPTSSYADRCPAAETMTHVLPSLPSTCCSCCWNCMHYSQLPEHNGMSLSKSVTWGGGGEEGRKRGWKFYVYSLGLSNYSHRSKLVCSRSME